MSRELLPIREFRLGILVDPQASLVPPTILKFKELSSVVKSLVTVIRQSKHLIE